MKRLAKSPRIAFQLVFFVFSSSVFASGAIESDVGKILKKYLNGNEVSLACGARVSDCIVETAVFGARQKFNVDFDKVSLKPTFANIGLMTQKDFPGMYLVAISVGARQEGIDYMQPIGADSIDCYASMEILDNEWRWVVVEGTPTYRSRTFELKNE